MCLNKDVVWRVGRRMLELKTEQWKTHSLTEQVLPIVES